MVTQRKETLMIFHLSFYPEFGIAALNDEVKYDKIVSLIYLQDSFLAGQAWFEKVMTTGSIVFKNQFFVFISLGRRYQSFD